MHITHTAAALAALATCGLAAAQTISGVTSNDSSSATDDSWSHETIVSPIAVAGPTASFTHTARLINTRDFGGGVAQTNSRRSSFEIAFTVEDPANLGFSLEADQFLLGESTVILGTGVRGDATGVSYFVQRDDSTDAAGTLTNETDLFIATNGVTNTVAGTTVSEVQSSMDEDVDLGSYVGTTDFLFTYTTNFTPTTNVFFQNDAVGGGTIDYGLGTPGTNYGHTVTFSATFVPEPASLAVLGLGGLALRRRR